MTETQLLVQQELKESQHVLDSFLSDPKNLDSITTAAEVMVNCIKNGGKIISFGNGGSHCDAMHFAEELSGRYRADRQALPAISISDPSHISCVSNDYGFDHIFSRFLQGLGNAGDVALGISTSGNSQNVIKAFEVAGQKGLTKVLLSGKDGGKLSAMADVEINVPHFGFSDRIQEIHIKVIHILILLIEKELT